MAIIFEFGKGKGKSYSSSLFPLNAELSEGLKENTIKEIAEQIAKQFKVSDGEIELEGISFKCRIATGGN